MNQAFFGVAKAENKITQQKIMYGTGPDLVPTYTFIFVAK